MNKVQTKISMIVTIITAVLFGYKKGFSHGQKWESAQNRAQSLREKVNAKRPNKQ